MVCNVFFEQLIGSKLKNVTICDELKKDLTDQYIGVLTVFDILLMEICLKYVFVEYKY